MQIQACLIICMADTFTKRVIALNISVRKCIFLGMQKNFAQILSCFPK